MKWLAAGLSIMLLLQGCTDKSESTNTPRKETSTVTDELHQATEQQDTEQVKKIIKDGMDLNEQDSQGRTPLMIAAYNEDYDTAKVLIEAGADVNIQDNMKNNPYLYASAEGCTDILRLTIEAGADTKITNRYGGTGLIPASEHGYVDVVDMLLTKTDVNVNHVNNLGWTALLEAIILNNGNEKQQKTVELLVQHGANVNLADGEGITPLEHAKQKGFKEIETLLIEAGAK
jgi:ankyrin repeat protein